jgi:hypothetical protein
MDHGVWPSVFELGKDKNDECSIVGSSVTPSPNVTATRVGPGMFEILGTRILPRSVVAGAFALSIKRPSFGHAPPIFSEGSYDFDRLGFTVTKLLMIEYSGVQNVRG